MTSIEMDRFTTAEFALEMIEGAIAHEEARGRVARIELRMGASSTVIALFVWDGPELVSIASTVTRALHGLAGLAGQRNCVDADTVVDADCI